MKRSKAKTKQRVKRFVIEVSQRLGDYRWEPKIVDGKFETMIQVPKYHAQVKGSPGNWAACNTPDEAIGDLIRCHPWIFGIKTNYLGKLPR